MQIIWNWCNQAIMSLPVKQISVYPCYYLLHWQWATLHNSFSSVCNWLDEITQTILKHGFYYIYHRLWFGEVLIINQLCENNKGNKQKKNGRYLTAGDVSVIHLVTRGGKTLTSHATVKYINLFFRPGTIQFNFGIKNSSSDICTKPAVI